MYTDQGEDRNTGKEEKIEGKTKKMGRKLEEKLGSGKETWVGAVYLPS